MKKPHYHKERWGKGKDYDHAACGIRSALQASSTSSRSAGSGSTLTAPRNVRT